MAEWLAIDIGGANIKAANGAGYADVHPFALWKERSSLAQELRRVIAEAPPSDHLALTMTGELADCFETKAEGVAFILQAAEEAADRRHTRVYLTNGKLVTPQVALRKPQLAAAANWHALARFAGRFAPHGVALVIDVGSTTVDVLPLVDGQPASIGLTDTQRLAAGEMVYSGVERSPLCAVLSQVDYRGVAVPLAHEVFATMRDVYLILGDLPEAATDTNTADGRTATKGAARGRLARSLCADKEEFNHRDAAVIAQAAADAQAELLAGAVRKVMGRLAGPPVTVVYSGHGEFLARRALEQVGVAATPVFLTRELGRMVSRCAPAHALAVLAGEA